MNRIQTTLLATGVTAAAATGLALVVVPSANAAHTNTPLVTNTLHFTNMLDTIQQVDAAPPGFSAGDSFYVGSHAVYGARGRTGAACTVVTDSRGGIKQCEVDFILSKGTITTRGLTDTAGALVTLIVTGGTRKYLNAQGAGTLTPTATGSEVVLRLK